MAKTAKASSTAPETPTQIDLSPEEIQAVLRARESVKGNEPGLNNVAIADLAAALTQALEATKPKEKKTPFNRPRLGPYEAKDGKPKPKLKKQMYHHGQPLQEYTLTPEEIELLNKVKAGSFCGGHVRVIKRKDRSLDIDYPIRTASQRLKLLNAFGIRNLKELCERLIAEAADPKQFKSDLDDED